MFDIGDYIHYGLPPVQSNTPAPPAYSGPADPNVDSYINSILVSQDAAAHMPTTSKDAAGNITTVPNTLPPSYISSDGAKFTDPAAYRAHQTQIDQTRTQTLTTAALAKAHIDAQNAVSARGLNYNDYADPISARLAQEQSLIKPFDTNPASYFDPNAADSVLSGLQATGRHNNVSSVNTTFDPNYDTTQIPTSMLSDTVNNLLSTGRQTAEDAAHRGLARGQFNQVGYDAAENNINNQAKGVGSSINSAANDVLNSYRSKLDGVRNNAFGAASNYSLGDKFDIGDYTKQAGDIVGQAQSSASGDLINQVGKAPLFDISSLIGAGGTAQGPQNLGNTDVAAALAAQRSQAQAQRGIGTQGSF